MIPVAHHITKKEALKVIKMKWCLYVSNNFLVFFLDLADDWFIQYSFHILQFSLFQVSAKFKKNPLST